MCISSKRSSSMSFPDGHIVGTYLHMHGRPNRRQTACCLGAHLDGFDQLVHGGVDADRAAAAPAAAAYHWDARAGWHDRLRSSAAGSGCRQRHHARCMKHSRLLQAVVLDHLSLDSCALDTSHALRQFMHDVHMSG